jgi:hypothetical protein
MGIAGSRLLDGCRFQAVDGASLVRRTSAVLIASCALMMGGCAQSPFQRNLNVEQPRPNSLAVRLPARPVHKDRVSPRFTERKVRRPDAALMAPQAAPDCEIQRSDFQTVDPEQWARLKIEFERNCYQEAEKAARLRLGLLQQAASCEIEPRQPPRLVRQSSARRP